MQAAGVAGRKRLCAVAVAAVTALSAAPGGPPAAPADNGRAEVRVGVADGDFRGDDHRALQAAVDYVAGQGGGTVRVAPGRYMMRNALALRDRVRVCGTPGKTVLAACPGFTTRLACDGDCNEEQITLEDASGFRVGDGVAVRDDQAGGFAVTTATLTERLDERTFRISAPLYLDYLVSRKATAALAFPVVAGWGVKGAAVEGLTVEGNGERAGGVDGCRAGGVYLFRCEGVTVRNCVVRGYNGDGISFQVSQGVTVEGCLCEGNAGLGLHPGSGSQRPVLRRNRSVNNGGDGLFVCWRVKRGLFEGNEVRGNKGAGISIGHKDTDNLFRGNTVTGNGGPGVLFRQESEAMGAHRNVFEANRILDNGPADKGGACVVVRGHHHDLVFRGNTIGRTKPAPGGVGILSGEHARGLQSVDNQFPNVEAPARVGRR
jgi:parallel beta-helix repeat protein